MAADWYFKISGEEVGPLSARQLRVMAEQGKLTPTDEIRQGIGGAWVAAGRIKGLFSEKPATASSVGTGRFAHREAREAFRRFRPRQPGRPFRVRSSRSTCRWPEPRRNPPPRPSRRRRPACPERPRLPPNRAAASRWSWARSDSRRFRLRRADPRSSPSQEEAEQRHHDHRAGGNDRGPGGRCGRAAGAPVGHSVDLGQTGLQPGERDRGPIRRAHRLPSRTRRPRSRIGPRFLRRNRPRFRGSMPRSRSDAARHGSGSCRPRSAWRRW